ncbi:MAG: transferrin-binding protein-like solute binding protein [Maritimibacter sp.]
MACAPAGGPGGTGGIFGEIDPNPPIYASLATGQGSGTLPFGGSFLRAASGSTEPDTQLSTASGSIRFSDGATTLSDGTVTITDFDGISPFQELADDFNTDDAYSVAYIKSSGGNYLTNDYEAMGTVRLIDGVVTMDGNVVTESLGVVGFATETANIPRSGSGTYTGEAWVRYVGNSVTDGIGNATGEVAALTDFGTGSVDLTISDIDDGADNANVPVDTIRFLGLTIEGNTISGTGYQASVDGATLEPAGAGSVAQVSGTFFGYDASKSGPDELGGTFLIKGIDGTLDGVFGAD